MKHKCKVCKVGFKKYVDLRVHVKEKHEDYYNEVIRFIELTAHKENEDGSN